MPDKQHRSIPPLSEKDIARFWKYVDKAPGHGPNGDCYAWIGGKNGKGYGRFSTGRKYRGIYAHRVSFIIANGKIPDGMCVLHHCDTPDCVRAEHLYAGTKMDNMREASSHKRMGKGYRKGSKNGRSVLSEEDVIKVRSLYAKGNLRSDIAKIFKVSWSTIDYIIKHETWNHI
jgi:hypothetical protein